MTPKNPSIQDRAKLLPYGIIALCAGAIMYLAGVLIVIPSYIFNLHRYFEPISEWLVWYSGIPIVSGISLITIDLFFLLDKKRLHSLYKYDRLIDPKITVALTAYNDQESITRAIEDFQKHPLVKRILVVSNNSTDETFDKAQSAGAIVFNESAPGYGRCVYRCLFEASKFDDTDFIVLCEGDLTYRSHDIDKLLAYAPHGTIVNGTRTVEPLRQFSTQLTTFMYYGNLFVGKLLESKHLGRCTVTDVGTTYKLCRREFIPDLLSKVDPSVNLEFNAHFLDKALQNGYSIIECPVSFHPRVGESKGGNVSNLRALKVGLRMIAGILISWKFIAA